MSVFTPVMRMPVIIVLTLRGEHPRPYIEKCPLHFIQRRVGVAQPVPEVIEHVIRHIIHGLHIRPKMYAPRQRSDSSHSDFESGSG
jgi:hypothetical protein